MKRYLAAIVTAATLTLSTATPALAGGDPDNKITGFHDGQQARGAITGCNKPGTSLWLEGVFRGIIRLGATGVSQKFSAYDYEHVAQQFFLDDNVENWYYEKGQENFNDRYRLAWVNVVCAHQGTVLFERTYHAGDDNRGGGGCAVYGMGNDGNHCLGVQIGA